MSLMLTACTDPLEAIDGEQVFAKVIGVLLAPAPMSGSSRSPDPELLAISHDPDLATRFNRTSGRQLPQLVATPRSTHST
jgi:hypothetical protein